MKNCTYIFISEISSVVLSLVLMASSLLKAVNVHSFAMEVMLFSELYVSSVFVPYCLEIACAVCSFELFLSLLLLHRRFRMSASFMSFVLLSFFVLLTGMNLFIPARTGSIESCGCFGELVHFSPSGAFFKSVVLWGVSILCLTVSYENKCCCRYNGRTRISVSLNVFGSLILSSVPPIFSLIGIERMNVDVYILAYIVMCTIIILYAANRSIVMVRRSSDKLWNLGGKEVERGNIY